MSEIAPQYLSQLLDQQYAPLVLYARQWCRTAEDVVQEALVRLVRQCPPPDNVVGWLYRVVRNEAISAGRSARRRGSRETAVAHRGEPWFVSLPGDTLDAAAATAALEELPPDQREAIIARLWGGLSLEELAELTSTSTSTAHRRYEAGLITLRERLGVVCPKKKNRIET
jgi:RNA polymerase sigma factor (sigma-70 family)